ncbi:MAG: DUF177 domain-containing protein [Ruminococcus sp.]|jgi:uncharacterized protein|nr:DUF177 domain-containing protein [Ruminococcus sp.]
MKINLKQVFNIVGESRDFDYETGRDELKHIKGISFSSALRIKGRAYNRAGVVYLDYTASFSLSLECDRCLKKFERNHEFDFSHIVVRELNGDNDDYIVAESESIEMNDIAITDILPELPSKNLCRDDCKGLCMVCGCDLNESVCNCLNTEL